MSQSETILLAVAGGALFALLLLILLRRRWRRRGIRIVDWQARVEAAERRAEHAEATVKAGLLQHLARLLRSRLVVGLLSQKRNLVATQQEGAARAEALEERLANAHADLQARLRDYESRLQKPDPAAKAEPATDPSHDAPAQAKMPVRKNPLSQRPVKPPPAPVKFADLVSRKQKREEAAPREPPNNQD